MFPIVLNHIDEDDEALLSEAHNETSGYSETSPLFQDNLRCTVGRRIARQFSLTSNRNQFNQSIQPSERIIEIKSESDDDEHAQTSTAINERTSLIDDYRFQRFRPVRIQEHDLTPDQDQTRVRRNYQVLRSKKRFTFPICFFVGLYISFLLMSSFIFTMFEQKMVNNDDYFKTQRQLMLSLTEEQFELVESLVRHSIQMQKGGLDAMSLLNENKILILEEADLKNENSNDTNQTTKLTNDMITENNISETATENTQQDTQATPLLRLSPTYTYFKPKSTTTKSNLITTNQIRNRRTYNWDFQQALFFVVSIATTIGYGNLSPESDNGKIYTIVFGLIAIPYTTILFSIIVSKFSNGPLRRFKLKLLTKYFTEKSHESLRIIRFICFILTSLFILFAVMGLPAALFGKMEKHWTYLDGFYFIFISITTTGLGDYVPEFFGTLHYWFYEFIVIIFLYFGIIMIMLWMTLIKSVFRRTISIKLDEYDQTDEEERHEQVLEEQVLINYHYHQKNYINYGSFYGYDEVSVRLPRK